MFLAKSDRPVCREILTWHDPLQSLAHFKNELIPWRGVHRLSICKLLRKSLLLADKWPDRDQTCTRWSPGKHASRVCSRSRSKVTWYAHFLGFLEWATPSLTVWFLLPFIWWIQFSQIAPAYPYIWKFCDLLLPQPPLPLDYLVNVFSFLQSGIWFTGNNVLRKLQESCRNDC